MQIYLWSKKMLKKKQHLHKHVNQWFSTYYCKQQVNLKNRFCGTIDFQNKPKMNLPAVENHWCIKSVYKYVKSSSICLFSNLWEGWFLIIQMTLVSIIISKLTSLNSTQLLQELLMRNKSAIKQRKISRSLILTEE